MEEPLFNPLTYQDFNPSSRNFVAPVSRSRQIAYALRSIVYEQPYVLGVDLSHWNGTVNFLELKRAGYEFVILKATEAVGYTDPTFVSRWPAALDAGLVVGPYHFFRSNYGGANQANHFLETIQPLRDATNNKIIPPCNDVETRDGVVNATRIERLDLWNNTVRTEIGRDPMCYSSPYLWQDLTGNAQMNVVGWTAHWTSAAVPSWPVGWPANQRLFWQYGVYPKHSWVSLVPGVTGEIDVNRFFGTRNDMNKLIGIDVEPSHDEKVEIMWKEYLERQNYDTI